MESLFLLAFGEQEYLPALAMAGSEAFFNKLLAASRRLPRRSILRGLASGEGREL
jgi:hypothetical protein